MHKIQMAPQRNFTMECCKMVAAMFVVFIHAPFPGGAGELVMAFGRFAVPMFFAISGYFNYGASSKQILHRLWHIIKLFAAALLLYIIWNCWMEGLRTFSEIRDYIIPDLSHVFSFLILHVHPFPRSEHLWYLIGLMAVYCVFWLYTRFYEDGNVNYQGFYIAGFVLFAFYFVFTVILSLDSFDIPYRSYRNGWLSGIPMFAMGIFLHEYQDQILRRFRLTASSLITLTCVGFLLTASQWRCGLITDMPFGILLVSPAIVLFCIRYPRLPFSCPRINWIVNRFGKLSTTIYLFHVMVVYTLEKLLPFFTASHPWLFPWLVLLISLVLAIVIDAVGILGTHFKTLHKPANV